jgi:SSS family solute:Na+ symporter
MGLSIYMLYVTPSKTAAHFGSASFAFSTWGFNTKVTIWTGIVGLIANLIVATVLTLLFARLPRGRDETSPADYEEAAAPAAVPAGPRHATGAG